MLPDRFPERVDPQRIFARNDSISSEIPLERFKRLSEYISDANGTVQVHLDFGFDENRRRLIAGTLSARVLLRCQRCLEDMPLDVNTALRVLVVSSDEQARALPLDVESVVAKEDGIELLALVEDEIILSLPIVPYHDNEACNEELLKLRQAEAGGEAKDHGNAFAKLRELKIGKTDKNRR